MQICQKHPPPLPGKGGEQAERDCLQVCSSLPRDTRAQWSTDNMVESRRPFFSHNLSLPSHLNYSHENWSFRSDQTGPNFDSDEDRDTDMSSPESFVSARETQPIHSALYDSFTNSMSLESEPKPLPSCKASSRSLRIGRPARSIGLKDMDLSNNPRADYIRLAKEANKSPKVRHASTPVRHLSSPNLYSVGDLSSYHKQISKSIEVPSVYNSLSASGCVVSTKDTFSRNEAKTRLPGNTPNRSRGQSTASYHGYKVNDEAPFIDLTGESDGDTVDEEVFTSPLTGKGYDGRWKFPSSDAEPVRHRTLMPSKKPRHNSREVNELGFSDDDDEDDVGCVKVKKLKEEEQSGKASHTAPHKSCCVLVLQFLLILLTAVVGFSLYLHYNPHGLCLEGEFNSNLTELEQAMEAEFYGQHLAKKIIMAALRRHIHQPSRKPLVLSLHGWTGIGKSFVSNLIAKHLFKRGYQSQFVHKIIVPLHFPYESEVEHYSTQLSGWIMGNVSQCNKRALFIFDEMDKISKGLADTLRPFLDHRGVRSGVDFKKSIFLFLSNSGGKAINQFALEHYGQGKEREEISLQKLEGILHVAEQNSEVWYGDMLRSELIDHFVPFLPMERGHVRQCIRQDLNKKGFVVEERIVTEIVDQMTYFPPDLELFSASGCKKVSSKVDVAMG